MALSRSTYVESEHPRKEDGEWVEKDGAGGGSSAQRNKKDSAKRPDKSSGSASGGVSGSGRADRSTSGNKKDSRKAGSAPGKTLPSGRTMEDHANGRFITGAGPGVPSSAGGKMTPGLSVMGPVDDSLRVQAPVEKTPEDARIISGLESIRQMNPEEQLRRIYALPEGDKFFMATYLDDSKLVDDESEQRLALAMSSVPPHIIDLAFDPSVGYQEFRQSLNYNSLPKAMRASTMNWVSESYNWASVPENSAVLHELDAQWRNVSYQFANDTFKRIDTRMDVLMATHTMLTKGLGLPPTNILFVKGANAPFETTANGRGGNPTIRIDLYHDAFDDTPAQSHQAEKMNGDNFSGTLGAFIHEMTHANQIAYRDSNHRNSSSGYVADPIITSFQDPIQFVDNIHHNNKPYLSTPLEMQAHIIHDAFTQSIRHILSKSRGR